ncbi:hypothetical protein N431DRAFT_203126 [Stipitochalara longipes BDJ]|nr:hypothetical protein N431DRAFT_203126 [Stipitochalara longipes BDJ]
MQLKYWSRDHTPHVRPHSFQHLTSQSPKHFYFYFTSTAFAPCPGSDDDDQTRDKQMQPFHSLFTIPDDSVASTRSMRNLSGRSLALAWILERLVGRASVGRVALNFGPWAGEMVAHVSDMGPPCPRGGVALRSYNRTLEKGKSKT